MELIDTHCHLNFPPLCEDPRAVLERAASRNVTKMIVPAYDIESFAGVAAISESDGVFPAFGLHPWAADQPIDLAALKDRLVQSNAVAVGEIGLDFKIESPDKPRQLEILEGQIGIADQLNLPVLLHCRGAFEELIELLGGFTPRVRGVVHAFSRGPELLNRFLDLNLYIAFGGAVTRPRAKQARRSAGMVPKGSMLLETDAPSIGLNGVVPNDVEPHHVFDIACAMAMLRNQSTEEIAALTTANAETLFRLNSPPQG